MSSFSHSVPFLKKQAKRLLKELQSHNSDALERVGQHLQKPNRDWALHDVFFVLARENGFRSWPDLLEHCKRERFSAIWEAMASLRQGGGVLLMDHQDRENVGDLCFAAETITADQINFMSLHARGTLCLALPARTASNLGLKLQNKNATLEQPAFTQSIDASTGIATGVSVQDKFTTIRAATRQGASSKSIRTPGHVFPLVACPGGVRERAGHTEGSVDLMQISGLSGSAVICEILREDGSMARQEHCEGLAKRWKIPFVTIGEIQEYRKQFG